MTAQQRTRFNGRQWQLLRRRGDFILQNLQQGHRSQPAGPGSISDRCKYNQQEETHGPFERQKYSDYAGRNIRQGRSLSGGAICVDNVNIVACKLTKYLMGAAFNLADFLAVPVALDRINAVNYPVWYKEKCTQMAGVVALIPMALFIFAVNIPKLGGVVMVEGECSLNFRVIDHFLSLLGFPAVLTVAVLTVYLVHLLKTKGRASVNDDQRSVTFALTISSLVVAIFGLIHYTFICVGFICMFMGYGRLVLVFMGMGQMVGTIGMLIRALILLTMRPMRKAFLRGLLNKK